MSEPDRLDEVSRRFIEPLLERLSMVQWDRFTVGQDAHEERFINVYGWIEREEDEYKDFVLLMCWPDIGEDGIVGFTTSSDHYSPIIHEELFGHEMSAEEENPCQRVEHTFTIENVVELDPTEQRTLTDGGEPQVTGTERLHVDLCTGLGGWKEPFEDADGWTTIGVDIRDDLNADVVADVRNLPLECSPDLLTMSPPCTEFSRYSMPWLDEPNPSTEIVEACLQAVEDLEPDWWVLENVRGLKQYCGRSERKRVGPFYLWGEFPAFDVRLADGSGKMQTSGESPEERAKIPYEIGDALRRSVEVFGR